MATIPTEVALPTENVRRATITALGAASQFNVAVTSCLPEQSHFAARPIRRHTHFAIAHVVEQVKNKPSQTMNWADNHCVEVEYDSTRCGDLLGKVFLHTRYNRAAFGTEPYYFDKGSSVLNFVGTKHPEDVQIAPVDEFGIAQILEARLIVGGVPLEKNTGDVIFQREQFGYSGPGINTQYMRGAISQTLLGAASEMENIPNSVSQESRVRVSEPSEYITNLHFHMGEGSDADDQIASYFPMVAMQRSKMQVQIALRKKVGLLKVIDHNDMVVDSVGLDAPPSTASVIRLDNTTITFLLDDIYKGYYLQITSGALSGETRKIVAYDAVNRDVTVSPPFSAAPANGVTSRIVRFAYTDAEIESTILTPNNAYGGFELLDMNLVSEQIFLNDKEREDVANRPHIRVTRYVKERGMVRVQSGESQVQLTALPENNVASYWWMYARDARLENDCKDYFDYSVKRNNGLIPTGLDNSSTVTLYWPRMPIDRVQIKLNDSVLAAASGHHFHSTAALLARHHKLPNQFIYSYSHSLKANAQTQHWGSLATSAIDNIVFDFQLARNNDAGTGVHETGTLRLMADSFTIVSISGGQVGRLQPTH